MTDEKLIEEMARAILETPMYDKVDGRCVALWRSSKGLAEAYAMDQAGSALAAYRQCTGDDGK